MLILVLLLELALVTYLVRRYVGLTNILNPIVPLYYYHTVFFFLALLYVERYNHIVISNEIVYLVMYGYLAFFGTAVLLHVLFRLKNGRILAGKFENDFSTSGSYWVAAFLLQTAVLVMIFVFYMQKGGLVLADDAENYRVEARKGLGFLVVIFRWVSEIFTVVGALFIFTARRVRVGDRLLFWFYYLISILFMFGLGSRAFVLDMVVIVVAIYYWSKRRNLDVKMLSLGAVFFVFLGLVGALRQGFELSGLIVFEKALWRPFVNFQNFQWIANDFNYTNYLNGASFGIELSTLLPGYQPNFGTWYKEEFGYNFSGGSITITYLGEAYANFGLVGALFFPVFLGVIIPLLAFLLQRRVSFFWVFMSIMVGLSLKGIINVGLGATFVGTVLPVFFCVMCYFFIRVVLLVFAKKENRNSTAF